MPHALGRQSLGGSLASFLDLIECNGHARVSSDSARSVINGCERWTDRLGPDRPSARIGRGDPRKHQRPTASAIRNASGATPANDFEEIPTHVVRIGWSDVDGAASSIREPRHPVRGMNHLEASRVYEVISATSAERSRRSRA